MPIVANDIDNNIHAMTSTTSLRRPIISQSESGRSISTSERLEQQGFKGRRTPSDFAMKSIRRGTTDWDITLLPFVADIVFESITQRRHQSENICFQPYTCHSAALFVDLSDYSKITAAIAHRGAHALSSLVNAYLNRLLLIVRDNGGDVVKFAGDAVLVLWYSASEDDLQINVLAAAKCAIEIQQKAGTHPVDGTTLRFRVHCGLSCGVLESEIFVAPNHVHMQRLFHSVGGSTIDELSDLVDVAKAGEVCISEKVAMYLRKYGTYEGSTDEEGVQCKILVDLNYEKVTIDEIELHINKCAADRLSNRRKSLQEDFIPPSVVKLLTHSGLSPTQISQMRNLCVLFIAMTSNFSSSVNWLMEVQTILDKHRCPIVQIIDDDKGVHLVAAVNLSESIPECSLLGLAVCRELSAKQVGCVIGMASGLTFCGVIGSSTVACRWDIAGPTPVRAARLMQYALSIEELDVAIDQSVYDDPMATTRVKLFNPAISLKGTKGTIPVYTLSESESSVAFRVLETVHARVHDDVVGDITTLIKFNGPCFAIIVTGVPLAGKKIICQRAAGLSDLVPYLHISDASAGFLQLADTIATWFRYVDDETVSRQAEYVLDLLRKQHWSRSHDECIVLVRSALSKGLRACFLIDRIQFLDEFSVSLLRECLRAATNVRRGSRRMSIGMRSRSKSMKSEHDASNICGVVGKVCFLCVHVSFYNWKTASEVANDISRSTESLHIPIIRVGQATNEGLRTMFRDLSDMEVEERWLDALAESSGNFAGYFIERAAAIRIKSSKLWSEGKRPLAETTEKLVLHIPYGLVRQNKTLSVMEVSAEVGMKFNQIFDELPPLFQTTLKIIMIASRNGFAYKLLTKVLWEVLNDLVRDGVDLETLSMILSELEDMCIVKAETFGDEEVVSFECPAFADVAFDVSTPVQIQSIADALIERLLPYQNDKFTIPFVLANLYYITGRTDNELESYWTKGYKMFSNASSGLPENETNKWKEIIHDEAVWCGYNPHNIFGIESNTDNPSTKVVGKILPLLKIYSAPVALGPMGHTLSVITRNIFHEFGVFHGAYSEENANLLREASISASRRYLQQMDVIEAYLAKNGINVCDHDLCEERKAILQIVKPAVNSDEVQLKAANILDDFVPRFVTSRLQRLHNLVDKLRIDKIPDVLQKSDRAIFRAYLALQANKNRIDAAQDALVILATMNWKPKPVPEFLPLLHYQTVARLRNKVLKRLSDVELFMFKHQQTHIDLEAFLITTALLTANGL